MNAFDDVVIDLSRFAGQDLQGRNTWTPFTPSFGSLTVVGATTYLGRLRFVGNKCEFQVKFSAATSIASAAGTDYLKLPVAPMGLSGWAVMMDFTTKVAVGDCAIDAAAGRAYLPTQMACADVFLIYGECEV